jgi:hypothetical protein
MQDDETWEESGNKVAGGSCREKCHSSVSWFALGALKGAQGRIAVDAQFFRLWTHPCRLWRGY